MQKYFNTVTNNRTGKPVAGASVVVTVTSTGGAAALYSDNGVTSLASNTLTTNHNGYFEFYSADGRYTLSISGAGIESFTIADVLLEDPADDKTGIAAATAKANDAQAAANAADAKAVAALDAAAVADAKAVSAQEKADAAVPASSLSAATGAAMVGFQQSGTGAAARAVQNKLRETVSAEDFGAVGDGVADDAAAIQSAIDWLASVGGGRLLFARGKTYGITGTVYVKSNVHLVGDGLPKIKAISAFQGAMVQFGYTTAPITDPDTNPCHNASIKGFDVDGNNLVTGKDWDPTNLLAAALDSALVYVWRNSTFNRIVGCKIHSAECDLVGAEDGADYVEIRSNEIYDATTRSAATQFINLMNVDGPENAIIVGNKCYDLKQSGYAPASWGYALRLHATDYALVQGNRFTSGWNVVLIDGRNNLIQRNTVTGGAARGIYLLEDPFICRFNSVVHNYVDGNGATGIQEQNAANVERNYIAYNTVRNSNSPLQVPLKNSIVHGNQVYDVAGNIQPEITRLNINKGATVDTSSNLASGTWTPATIDNTTNLSGTAITDAQYMRVGNVVYFSGNASTTITASGAYEFRFTMPIDSVFSADTDANGTASDSFSAYGLVAALTTGTPRRLRVQGSATSSGAKTIRFSGSYLIK